MEFMTGNFSSLDIIFGPMFSGKTTELFRRLSICLKAKYKVLYINSELDTRSVAFSTHNEILQQPCDDNFAMVKTCKLADVFEKACKYDVIGIDEAQFFDDLQPFCVAMAEVKKKKIIVSGLNGDFERKPFGQLNNLITLSDSITKLFPFCQICRDSNKMIPALFSKRIGQSKATVLIGKTEFYLPVCRECYLEDTQTN